MTHNLKYSSVITSFLILFSRLLFAQTTNLELTEINFIGNENISSTKLESVISSKESPGWFSQFLNDFTGFGSEAVYFDSSNTVFDIGGMRDFYKDNGYFEVNIDYDYLVDTADKEVTLNYYIKEGEPVYFHSFTVTGIDYIHKEFQESIKEIAAIDTSDIFEKVIVEEKRIEILTYLRNKGLMLAASDLPRVMIDTMIQKADVSLFIDPGKRYKLSEIRVSKSGPGMDLVTDKLISDIVDMKEGEYYNFGKIQLAQTRLYRTNLFNTALISGITVDTSGNLVPLQVSTDVGLLYEFSPELIVNSSGLTGEAFNLGLSFGFTRKNFLGAARKLSITASSASPDILRFLGHTSISNTSIDGYADFRLLIDQPFLFGKPIYTKFEEYLTLQKRKSEYNATIIGSKLSLDFELPRKVYLTSLSTYFNFENTKFRYDESYINDVLAEYPEYNYFGTDSIQVGNVRSNNSVIGVQLQSINTDDIIYPADGYSLRLTLENANLFPYLYSKLSDSKLEEPQYYKARFTGTGFIPLSPLKTSTLGFKFSIGQIFTYSGDKFSIPFNQRFSSGGSNSVRGWGARELVTGKADINFDKLTPEVLEAIFKRGATLGGYFIVESSAEYRQKFLENFGVAFFADAGNTLFGAEDFKFGKMAVALGFGLRYYSQIVPVRLDFGFKYFDPNDKRSIVTRLRELPFFDVMQFHIGIGEAF